MMMFRVLAALVLMCGVARAQGWPGPIGVTQPGINSPFAATGRTSQATVATRFSHTLNVIDDFGAVADATGSVGVGTDDTNAFANALGTSQRVINVPPGSYRITSAVAIAAGTSLQCSARGATTIWLDDPTGTSDGITANGNGFYNISNCFIFRTSQATAGALVHATNVYQLTLANNRISYSGNGYAFNDVVVDCTSGGQAVNEIHFTSNYFEANANDGVFLNCPTGGNSIADVFFDGRNYASGATRAGVELAGSVGWTHFDHMDFDQNTNGTAILGNSSSGTNSLAAYITVHHSHFEGNAADIVLNSYNFPLVEGNEFLSTGGIVCSGCSQGVSGGNSFATNTGLTLLGVADWTETGSSWSTTNASRTGMIQVGPSGTSPSSGIVISGANFPFTIVPFLVFTGLSYPTNNVKLDVLNGQGTCFSGTNYTNFTYNCSGINSGITPSVGDNSNLLATTSFVNSRVAKTTVYTSSGTWTPQTGSSLVTVYAIAPGGGGGGGAMESLGTIGTGGAGGGAGSCKQGTFRISTLTTPVSITVSSGGSAGVGASSNGPGGNGGNSSTSQFGYYLIASGSGYGQGGQTATASTGGGAAGFNGSAGGQYFGGNGGSNGTTGGAGAGINYQYGGGSGAGSSTSQAFSGGTGFCAGGGGSGGDLLTASATAGGNGGGNSNNQSGGSGGASGGGIGGSSLPLFNYQAGAAAPGAGGGNSSGAGGAAGSIATGSYGCGGSGGGAGTTSGGNGSAGCPGIIVVVEQ